MKGLLAYAFLIKVLQEMLGSASGARFIIDDVWLHAIGELFQVGVHLPSGDGGVCTWRLLLRGLLALLRWLDDGRNVLFRRSLRFDDPCVEGREYCFVLLDDGIVVVVGVKEVGSGDMVELLHAEVVRLAWLLWQELPNLSGADLHKWLETLALKGAAGGEGMLIDVLHLAAG